MANTKTGIKFFYKIQRYFIFFKKVSFTDFAKYIETKCPEIKLNFANEIYPRIKNLATMIIRAVFSNIDPNHFNNTFEVLNKINS